MAARILGATAEISHLAFADPPAFLDCEAGRLLTLCRCVPFAKKTWAIRRRQTGPLHGRVTQATVSFGRPHHGDRLGLRSRVIRIILPAGTSSYGVNCTSPYDRNPLLVFISTRKMPPTLELCHVYRWRPAGRRPAYSVSLGGVFVRS